MVSVIIPIYKVERYLRKCIDSVLNQTYQDFEIILVDDCSPDNCPAICDEYAKNDDRIKVIHKENGGLSSARNAGIKIASGEYLAFVDSDDTIEQTFLQTLVDGLENNGTDLCATKLKKVFENSSEEIEQVFSNSIEIVTDKKFDYALTEEKYAGFVTSMLFKREILVNNNLLFDEKIFHGEDLPFTLEYLTHCDKVCFIDSGLYLYLIRENSITTSVRFNKRQFTILRARERVLDLIKEYSPKNYNFCKATYLMHAIKQRYLLEPIKKENQQEYEAVISKIKNNKKGLLFWKDVSTKLKIKLFLMITFRRCFGTLYRKTKAK